MRFIEGARGATPQTDGDTKIPPRAVYSANSRRLSNSPAVDRSALADALVTDEFDSLREFAE